MDSMTLSGYVADRIKAGVSKADIREELIAVGWSEEEADAAFRDGLLVLGVPTPDEGDRPSLTRKSSAADIVLNVFSFILLGIVATALGMLYFGVIGKSFPDALDSTSYYNEAAAMGTIHYSIAALLIAFPLYFVAMRLWFRKFREDEGRTESRLSKWLTYIVLLAASVTIVGDLITVVFTLLQGEITARFFLKALVILGIAGIVFGFYFLERKRIQYRKDIPRKVFQSFGVGVSGFVVLGIALGFFASGSPETARMRAFDADRSNDLSMLSGCVEGYANDLGQLPSSLSELRQASAYAYCASSMRDPETKEEYGYRVVSPSRSQGAARVGEFELCADFSLAVSDTGNNDSYYDGGSAVWNEHAAGRDCDTVTVQLVGTTPVPVPSVPMSGNPVR